MDEPVISPVVGKVLSIKVKEGEYVKENDVVLTMDVLKLETEIVAPKSGKIKEIKVKTGDQVELGSTLMTIDVEG
ncbi:MAG: biotin/lipoyl-containing protein [Candidatus Methanomethylicaceae archaeon]